MKAIQHRQGGLSILEVLVVLACLVVLVILILPGFARPKDRNYTRIKCANSLKQMGISYRIWANDHEDKFSFVSTNADSSLAWVNSPEVFRHYQVMSNELVTPKVLICGADKERKMATDFVQFSNANLSYFVGLDAREDTPNSILSGDRNITGGTLSNGFLRVLRPGTAVEWTKEIHQNTGNIGLGDGSVQQVTTVRLRQQIALQTNAFIRLAVP
jgi:type II secretory pathway pseudopilin PulG